MIFKFSFVIINLLLQNKLKKILINNKPREPNTISPVKNLKPTQIQIHKFITVAQKGRYEDMVYQNKLCFEL